MKIHSILAIKTLMPVGALTLLLGVMSSAQAQFTGPGALPEKTSLAEVLANPVDDQRVKLRGHVIKQLSSDKYLFSDGRQQIRIEIDRKLLPSQPFDQEMTLVIEGEVEKDFMESPEIDVDRVSIVR